MNKHFTANGKQTETMEQCNALIINSSLKNPIKTIKNYQHIYKSTIFIFIRAIHLTCRPFLFNHHKKP